MKNIEVWEGGVDSYKLLDSGEGEKLEEINGKKIVRKEPRGWWLKTEAKSWNPRLAGGQVESGEKSFEEILDIGIAGVKAKVKFKESSKHIGIFPEQAREWQWIRERILNLESRISDKPTEKRKLKILNLFGYTGVASLVAAASGAEVTHVDSSKQSVEWARENQKISGLEDLPIRWIVDDAVKFLKREIKRMENVPAENQGYDAIIMDPPSYGKGPKGEVWKAEDKLPDFLKLCSQALSNDPHFVILNMYSTELSSLSLSNMLLDMMQGRGGSITSGELAIKQEGSAKILPMSIFSIWER